MSPSDKPDSYFLVIAAESSAIFFEKRSQEIYAV